MFHYRYLLLVVIVVIAACGGNDKNTKNQDLPLYDVCNGTAVAEAPAYDSTVTGEHPYKIYVRRDAAEPFEEYDRVSLLTSSGFPEEVEFVVCVTITPTELVLSCDYYGNGEFTIEHHNADVDVSIYAAQTGEQLHQETLVMNNDKTICPDRVVSTERRVQTPSLADSQEFSHMILPFRMIRE